MNTNTNHTPADINKMIEQRLAELPEVKAALEAANASAEAQAASARKIVLDELAEVEHALADMKPIGAELDADIEAMRRQLRDLTGRRAQHANQTQQIGARARDLVRTLNAEHGGGMINAVVNQLRVQATNLRDSAEGQRQLTIMTRNRWGDTTRVQDPEALAKAEEMTAHAEHTEAAMRDIEYLTRQPISPQEIRRRIAEAVESVGLKLTVEDVRPINTWHLAGWSKGKRAA